MANDLVVRYKNEINQLNLSNLNSTEANVFTTLISKLKDVGDKPVFFSFDDFRRYARIDKNINNSELQPLIISTLKKIGAGSLSIETKEKWIMFPIFNKVEVDKANEKITYSVSETFYQFFNDFINQYTVFPLLDFTKLRSKYAKALYRTLMQFKTSGNYHEEYNKFVYEVLGIPEKTPTSNINYKFINANVAILKKEFDYFSDLEVNYVRRGKKFSAVEFTWTPQSKDTSKAYQKAKEDAEFDKVMNQLEEDKVEVIDSSDDDLPF